MRRRGETNQLRPRGGPIRPASARPRSRRTSCLWCSLQKSQKWLWRAASFSGVINSRVSRPWPGRPLQSTELFRCDDRGRRRARLSSSCSSPPRARWSYWWGGFDPPSNLQPRAWRFARQCEEPCSGAGSTDRLRGGDQATIFASPITTNLAWGPLFPRNRRLPAHALAGFAQELRQTIRGLARACRRPSTAIKPS